jgi:hypothetical protein
MSNTSITAALLIGSVALPHDIRYSIVHTINSAGCNLTSAECVANLTQYLNFLLRPTLGDAVIDARACQGYACNLTYQVSYSGYGDPDIVDISKFINDRTKQWLQTAITNISKTGSHQSKLSTDTISIENSSFRSHV